jgi:hypothetical protein
MKKTYNDIAGLKSKSGMGFTWDDEHGMGVTEERRPEWEDLCKVREHLTCRLSMTSDH